MVDRQKPYYIIEGKVYARVTRILSIIRDIEYEGNPDPLLMDEAAAVGTKVHKIIERNLKGLTSPSVGDPRVHSCWKAYQDWKRTREPLLPQSEVLVWSDKHMVAATIDLIDTECVTDFKTSSRLLLRHWLQVNANAAIYNEWKQRDGNLYLPYKCRLLRLDKTLAMYEEEVKPFSEPLWETFLKVKEVYIDILGEELLEGELEAIQGGEHGD